MRAKLRISEVEPLGTYGQTIKAFPVCGKPFGPNGESEDNTFSRYTPNGLLELSITNPDLAGKIKVGQEFYVDFTEVEAPVEGQFFHAMKEQETAENGLAPVQQTKLREQKFE